MYLVQPRVPDLKAFLCSLGLLQLQTLIDVRARVGAQLISSEPNNTKGIEMARFRAGFCSCWNRSRVLTAPSGLRKLVCAGIFAGKPGPVAGRDLGEPNFKS